MTAPNPQMPDNPYTDRSSEHISSDFIDAIKAMVSAMKSKDVKRWNIILEPKQIAIEAYRFGQPGDSGQYVCWGEVSPSEDDAVSDKPVAGLAFAFDVMDLLNDVTEALSRGTLFNPPKSKEN